MNIEEAIVDRSTLRSFQRRAYKVYPKEHYEVVCGIVRGKTARISSFATVEYQSTRDAVWTEDESISQHSRTIGSVHTHPNGTLEPSTVDICSAKEDKLSIFGICAVRRRANRWYVEWAFFNPKGKRIRLTVCDGKAT